jgi:hypothetical protein
MAKRSRRSTPYLTADNQMTRIGLSANPRSRFLHASAQGVSLPPSVAERTARYAGAELSAAIALRPGWSGCSGAGRCSKKLPYSITSSAIVRLSALAVLRFMLRVTLIAGSIGRSTGCAPLRMCSVTT